MDAVSHKPDPVGARDADDGAVQSRSRPPIRTACCSTGWATSTSCSSTTPRSPSRALGIVLTKRGKHLGADIPMCGVPVERADEYLHKLIALGHRVAVCEQIEDPAEAKKRGAKSVVRRDVTRLVTPGTLTEDTLLDARRNNYLAAICARARRAGRRGDVRARLDRHLDRRIRRRRARPRRARRRDRAARARRDHRLRRALRRCRAGAVLARRCRR